MGVLSYSHLVRVNESISIPFNVGLAIIGTTNSYRREIVSIGYMNEFTVLVENNYINITYGTNEAGRLSIYREEGVGPLIVTNNSDSNVTFVMKLIKG